MEERLEKEFKQKFVLEYEATGDDQEYVDASPKELIDWIDDNFESKGTDEGARLCRKVGRDAEIHWTESGSDGNRCVGVLRNRKTGAKNLVGMERFNS